MYFALSFVGVVYATFNLYVFTRTEECEFWINTENQYKRMKLMNESGDLINTKSPVQGSDRVIKFGQPWPLHVNSYTGY